MTHDSSNSFQRFFVSRFSMQVVSLCLVAVLLPFFGCSEGEVRTVEFDGPESVSNMDLELDELTFDAPVPSSADHTDSHATHDSHAAHDSHATHDSHANHGDSHANHNDTHASHEAQETHDAVEASHGEVQHVVAIQEEDHAGEAHDSHSDGVLQKAGDLFDKAKSTTGSTAKGAKDWVQEKIGGASDATSAVAEDSAKWATETFESLKSQGLTTAKDTGEWLSQDWNKMGSWEYKIVEIGEEQDFELTNQLNKLGGNGWECYHISDKDTNRAQKLYLKKRKESYLRNLPFKDFIKLVPLIQQATN